MLFSLSAEVSADKLPDFSWSLTDLVLAFCDVVNEDDEVLISGVAGYCGVSFKDGGFMKLDLILNWKKKLKRWS